MIRKSSAFTMMEILVVLGIIAVILAFVGPQVGKWAFRGKENETRLKMAKIKSALLDYSNDMGHYPTEAEGGLNALVEPPRGLPAEKANRWKGPYLKGEGALEDGWKEDFVYIFGKNNLKNKRDHDFLEIISNAGGSGEEIIDGI
ncbi:type II secretion system protein GspG [Candidatus Babeliales bacterium]|nr:type II secretion system protein GspG [Candidatus Babeliales bacterium]